MIRFLCNKRIVQVSAAVIAACVFALPILAIADIQVSFLDVGQGDAAIVICDGEVMMIDGGLPSQSQFIYSYLKQHEISHIDYMVATHPHDDHIGGLPAAFNIATVDNVVVSSFTGSNRSFTSLSKYIRSSNAKMLYANVGSKFSLGKATVEIIGPVYPSSIMNDTSIVLKITYGKVSFLFTGDMETQEECDVLDAGADVSATVLKVAHHGGETSTSPEFLLAVSPKYAVISVGEGNDYGHPNVLTLDKLKGAGSEIYRTDTQGTITFCSNGKSITVKTEKNRTETAAPSPTLSASAASAPQIPDSGGITYVVNKNSKKFHYPDCRSVKQIKDKNRMDVDLSRDELIKQGYSPCGNCRP